MLAIMIETDAFMDALQGRNAGSPADWPRMPHALNMSEPQRRSLFAAIAELTGMVRPDSPQQPREHAEQHLISVLAGLEDWIEAHLSGCISLGRLCEVAQMGGRSLQLAFKARRGMSPMRFVAERRLAVAQRQISNAAADDDVTAIATRLGFTHLGRFSMAYRAAHGESPSHTMQRGRRSRTRGSIA